MGEWLYARVDDRVDDDKSVAAQSSYSMKDVKEGRLAGVGAVGSRRLRRARGSGRRAVARAVEESGSTDEAQDELPVL